MSLARMHGGSTPQIIGGRGRDLIGQADMIGGDIMATVNDALATVKEKLCEKTFGVPNYVFAAAAVAGVTYYVGKKRRWFK